ncbi:Na+/H+ antiporter [soil metagenome]
MDGVVLGFVLVVGVVVSTPLSERLRVPQPVLLTVFGLALAAVPGLPELEMDPELILPLVLPPLLFAATQRTTVREFRDNAGAVLFLAVGLTLATLGVAASVAHLAGLPWVVALVLGAMVCPPDPVAATAVARRLRLPHRLVTILEGEGMFNDATALVAFKVTVVAAVSGEVSAGSVGLALMLAVVVGVAAGVLLGAVTKLVLGVVHDGYAETTITVLAPFVAYLGAEHLRGSGVLAVLVLGLFLRTYGHQATTSGGWLLGRAVWSYADYLITSLVFALLGYELVNFIGSAAVRGSTVALAAEVVASLVLVRIGGVFASEAFAGRRARRRDDPFPSGWRESTVVSWAGMRGVVTVATALALPAVVDDGTPFPYRDEIVVVALVSVLATLVVQGLTLTPLTSWLGVGRGSDDTHELADLRREAAQAALRNLRDSPRDDMAEPVLRAATVQYEGYLAAQSALEDARRAEPDEAHDPPEQLRSVLRRATDVERALVLDARRRGRVSPDTADEALRDIEGRALRDFG